MMRFFILMLVICAGAAFSGCNDIHLQSVSCHRDCSGCCTEDGQCIEGGGTASACGSAGAQCVACAEGETCVAGQCRPPGCGGCLSSANQCLPGNQPKACGSDGAECSACAENQDCIAGACRLRTDPGCLGIDRWIAFDSNRALGNRDLYMMRLDTCAVKRLTQDPTTERAPVFSPDGREIAFASDRTGKFEIFIMDLATSMVRQVTMAGGDEPDWSPDGTRIAFQRGLGIYTIKTDGTGESLVAEAKPTFGDTVLNPYAHPSFLNANVLLFDHRIQIDRIQIDGAEHQQIVPLKHVGATPLHETPAASPDGSIVVLATWCSFEGYGLRLGSANGVAESACGPNGSQLTPPAEHDPARNPTWGPDWIAYDFGKGNGEIMTVQPPAGEPKNLTQHASDDRHPAWAPANVVIPK